MIPQSLLNKVLFEGPKSLPLAPGPFPPCPPELPACFPDFPSASPLPPFFALCFPLAPLSPLLRSPLFSEPHLPS